MLERYKLWRLEQVLKACVKQGFKMHTAIFNWRIKKDHLLKSPIVEIEGFKIEKKYMRFFSKAEIRLILNNTSEYMYPATMILLLTGIKKGELTCVPIHFRKLSDNGRYRPGDNKRASRSQRVTDDDDLRAPSPKSQTDGGRGSKFAVAGWQCIGTGG